MEHPFADGAKLKILNAKYTTPDDPKNVSDIQPLIGTLKNQTLKIIPFLFCLAIFVNGVSCELLQVVKVTLWFVLND